MSLITETVSSIVDATSTLVVQGTDGGGGGGGGDITEASIETGELSLVTTYVGHTGEIHLPAIAVNITQDGDPLLTSFENN